MWKYNLLYKPRNFQAINNATIVLNESSIVCTQHKTVHSKYFKYHWLMQNKITLSVLTQFSFSYKVFILQILGNFIDLINIKQIAYNISANKKHFLQKLYRLNHGNLTCPPCCEQFTQPTWMLPCLTPGMICSRSKLLPKITTSHPDA